jgi:hypothetical protein
VTASWLPDRFRRPVPWRVGDALALVGTTGAGLLLIVIAWFCADGAASVDSQVRWLNVGVVGLIALGVGNLLWLMTCRRAIGELRRVVLPRIPIDAAPARGSMEPADRAADGLVATASMTRFHRPACPFAAGKPVRAATEAAHRRKGRRPCDLCRPVDRAVTSDG